MSIDKLFRNKTPSPWVGAALVISFTMIVWLPLGVVFPPALLFPVLVLVKAYCEQRRAKRARQQDRRTWGF